MYATVLMIAMSTVGGKCGNACAPACSPCVTTCATSCSPCATKCCKVKVRRRRCCSPCASPCATTCGSVCGTSTGSTGYYAVRRGLFGRKVVYYSYPTSTITTPGQPTQMPAEGAVSQPTQPVPAAN